MFSRFYPRLSIFRDCSVGMRGLPNYHLSCCVNTLLQTLSATWEVAALLEKWEAAGLRGDDRNVPLQLKRVLADMRGTQPQHAPHRDFLHCLHRNCIRLSTQHDANEVFLFILSFIQQQIDDKPLALEIQNLYKISMETQLQCLECNNIQSKGSYLLSLPLHIKEDHNSLEGCMASFFQHQELSGINCCFCQCCETKRPSRQGVRLRSLPRILCMQLKRFRNTLGSTRKLDCRVTFPETFDFSEVVPEALCRDFVQDNCSYTLYAVVVHSGTAMCGHYTAYVCVKERWYHADDSHVQLASWEEVQTTFGERYGRTAYILMYRRGSREEGHRRSDLSG
ncbi:ubl carboxyl-terminal hydrolase 18 isoform X2 [Parambassis ranga]|uniref:Ubl carboxyl-terminal hydrolase 18 isoform X2 n=1 Tax=Parambassis ranga TaxID=210632 RepID=A0A6P7I0Z1_9TELE|nr:ubl carboxyl-terminal hydrolase 18 isoform X2 [Parambassis ranga]